ncbi:uncharacterized protein AMSG_03687 [Thecamonas trahens ATCC 50062]|uniref:ubiquitinyl hydrolase 1 n=1 Tax=Thecamonas trahens ATCC 50062 TaxID=461836 RepID=A0A0L0D4G4_THETB|nr:hypothetical protein AMSG_03687 [Thecamonas trahens ATCC 50062]KNC47257.1 hypothetical protein AMSG_03687 [Thecamonas trahens ATCC 50062]|eukprot:XP_013759600.1 hypothetical protein AMSG_03687 [Thecamonas trahens ATCC 50062]
MPAIWRNGAFAGEFGDPYIKDTNLEGGLTAPSIRKLNEVVSSALTSHPSLLETLVPGLAAPAARIQALMEELASAAEIDELKAEMVESKSLEGMDAFLELFMAKIRAIPVGGILVMGGGWMGKASGHALLYVLEREADDAYAFVACNTGEGIQYHPSLAGDDLLSRKRKTALRIPGIPAADFLDPAFWYMIWKLRVTNKEENSAAVFYEVLLAHLAAASVLDPAANTVSGIVAADAGGASSGDFDAVQLSGTCYYKCIVAALHYLNKRAGLSRVASDQIVLFVRLAYLLQTGADLDDLAARRTAAAASPPSAPLPAPKLASLARSLAFNDSDARMVAMACAETARSAVALAEANAATAETLSAAALAIVQDCIADVTAAANAAADAAAAAPDDLPRPATPSPTPTSPVLSGSLESAATAPLPFTGFAALADTRDTSAFVGDTTEAAPELYVDLLPPPAALDSLPAVLGAIHDLADATRKLRFKTSHCADSLAVFQITALVEHVLTSSLPIPGSSSSSVWPTQPAPPVSGLTPASQEEALLDLRDIALQYMSCSWSLSPDRALDAHRALTMGGLLALFDALARLSPDSAPPSPLTTLLAGASQSGHFAGTALGIDTKSFTSASFAAATDAACLYRPAFLALRAAVITYFVNLPQQVALFAWSPARPAGPSFLRRMMETPQYTLTEDDVTLKVVAELLHACGLAYTLPPMPRGRNRGATNPDAMSDVERLVRWAASDWSALPAFAALRDLIFLFKLSLEPHMLFFLANEPLAALPVWHASHVRPDWRFFSANQEGNAATLRVAIADPRHNLTLGVGSVHSFASLSVLANNASEAAILHAHTLTSFDGTLSPQESERLLSFLTQRSLAIPLILEFFAASRVGYLLNPYLQQLLESVLFEPGPWTPSLHAAGASIVDVPLAPDAAAVALATPMGRLMHEVLYAPASLLPPLLALLRDALGLCSQHYDGPFVPLLLYLVRLATRVLSFAAAAAADPDLARLARSTAEAIAAQAALTDFLATAVVDTLAGYIAAAEAGDDLKTSTSLHVHITLVYGAVLPGPLAHADAFLASSAFVVSWHSESFGARSWPQDINPRLAVPTADVPVHDTFFIYELARPQLVAAVATAPQSALDATLSRVVAAALQREAPALNATPAWRGWSAVADKPLLCTHVVESAHPYPNATDYYETVSFPGAPYITLYFDPKTSTEASADYITIYKDASCTSYWGRGKRMSGSPAKGWPGAGGAPPLVIPADSFVFHFHSDATKPDWGYRLIASAPVAPAALAALVDLPPPPSLSRQTIPPLLAQHALVATSNVLQDAYTWLAAATPADLSALVDAGSSAAGDDAVAGMYRDPMSVVVVNIQTAEVYLRSRMLMPVPIDVAGAPDFTRVLGDHDSLFCAVLSANTSARTLSVMAPEGVHTVVAWRPLTYDAAAAAMAAAAASAAASAPVVQPSHPASSSSNTQARAPLGGLPDQPAYNMPRRAPNGGLAFNGRLYNDYTPGSLSWISSKLDVLVDDALASAEIADVPLLWVSDAVTPASLYAVDSHLIMYMPPSGDLEAAKGHVGGFYAIVASPATSSLAVYALPDAAERDEPWLPGTRYAAGNLFDLTLDKKGQLIPTAGAGERVHDLVGSVVISRPFTLPRVATALAAAADAQAEYWGHALAPPKLSVLFEPAVAASRETYVPPALLTGLLPAALVQAYHFWRPAPRLILGYPAPDAATHCPSAPGTLLVVTLSPRIALPLAPHLPPLPFPLIHAGALCDAYGRNLCTFSGALSSTSALTWDAAVVRIATDGVDASDNERPVAPCIHTLINVAAAPPSSPAAATARIFTRIENLSHVLVWSTGVALAPTDQLPISLVELPRLRTRFALRASQPPSSSLAFASLDYDGLAVAPHPRPATLAAAGPLSHYLVLEDASRQQHLMVPNAPLLRVKIKSCPFSSDMALARDAGWLDAVATRVYVYPIHISGAYLLTPSLSAAFYLFYVSLMTERWVVSLLAASVDDKHPDAHALRLRFGLIIRECGETVPWEFDDDVSAYLAKYPHVSSLALVPLADERRLVSDPHRIALLDALDAAATAGELAVVTGPPAPPVDAGRLWYSFASAVPNTHAQLSAAPRIRIRYNKPASPLAPPAVFRALEDFFDDTLDGREGSGFAFLYDALVGGLDLGLWLDGGSASASPSSPPATPTRPAVVDGQLACPACTVYYPAVDSACNICGTPNLLAAAAPSYATEDRLALSRPQRNLLRFVLRAKLLLITNSGATESVPARDAVLLALLIATEAIVADLAPGAKAASLPALPPGLGADDTGRDVASFLPQLLAATAPVVSSPTWAARASAAPVADFAEATTLVVDPKVAIRGLELAPDTGGSAMSLLHAASLPVHASDAFVDAIRQHSLLLAPDDHAAALSRPLAGLGLDAYITRIPLAATDLLNALPFDLSSAAEASLVAHNMLDRMASDLAASASAATSASSWHLVSLDARLLSAMDADVGTPTAPGTPSPRTVNAAHADHLRTALASLKDLGAALDASRLADLDAIRAGVAAIARLANAASNPSSLTAIVFDLKQTGAVRIQLWFELVVAALQASEPARYLAALNPHLDAADLDALLAIAATVLVRTVRLAQTNAALASLATLTSHIHELLERRLHTGWSFLRLPSPGLIAHALAAADYDPGAARSAVADLLNAAVSLEADLAASLRLSDEVASRMVSLVLASTSYSLDAASAILATPARLAPMVDAAARGCLYNGVPLKLPPAHPELVGSSASASSLVHLVEHTGAALARILGAKRAYVDETTSLPTFDPRFLVFEFSVGFMLRARQVELIGDFAAAAAQGSSSVHQMIMGAGKTTVIGPMLGLILANGSSLVTQVVPGALLDMSRNVLRTAFSNVMPKRIYTLAFDRSSPSSNSIDAVRALAAKLRRARAQRALVVTTPEAVKSLMLKYVDLLQSVQSASPLLRLPRSALGSQADKASGLASQLRTNELLADELATIIKLWSADEDPLPLEALRWDLPLHLLDAVFFTTTGRLALPGFRPDPDALAILRDLAAAVHAGVDMLALQTSPHLVLLSLDYYHASLRPLFAAWAKVWLLAAEPALLAVDADVVSYLGAPTLSPGLKARVSAAAPPRALQLLNLARSWVVSFLPHVLAKICRVRYGLLSPADIDRWSAAEGAPVSLPLSRSLLAVPFVGKDVPSRSAEFAHPEVLLGTTILAYRYEGLRRHNMRTIVLDLKARLLQETGPFAERPSRRLFADWLDAARLALPDPSVAPALLPLELFQPADPRQLDQLVAALAFEPLVIHHFVTAHVFPQVMRHQELKLQASGVDLGGDMLFGVRLGFSGTPSDLLPRSLQPCHYEPGSEAKIIRVLSSPTNVSVSLLADWSVDSILASVACPQPGDAAPFSALIDTGALITGLTNEQVARKLLAIGLEGFDVCVFLDASDRKMCVDRTPAPPVPLNRSGVALGRRFTFYDQVHTTGMDIRQATDARAAVTLGKDMTLRDYSQGCYRMRGLGRGQTLHLFIVAEVAALVDAALPDAPPLASHPPVSVVLRAVLAWLITNSIASEKLQHLALCQQELHSVWRKQALDSLLTLATAPQVVEPSVALLPSRFWDPVTDPGAIDAIVAEHSLLTDSERAAMAESTAREAAGIRLTAITSRIASRNIPLPVDLRVVLSQCSSPQEAVTAVLNLLEACGYAPSEFDDDASDASAANVAVDDGDGDGPTLDEVRAPFSCTRCTMFNAGGGRSCEVCNSPRDFAAERAAAAAAAAAAATAAAIESPPPSPSSAASPLQILIPPSPIGSGPKSPFSASSGSGSESGLASVGATPSPARLVEWLNVCVEIFRETLGTLQVPDVVPEPVPFSVKLRSLAFAKRAFLKDPSASLDVENVIAHVEAQEARAAAAAAASDIDDTASALGYDAEMEQEQEQEEEAQQEVQQEEQVHVDYASTPPIATTWPVMALGSPNSLVSAVFYPLATFVLQASVPPLAFPPSMLLSENYATALHRSDLPRRLRNIDVIAEWTLPTGQSLPAHLPSGEPVQLTRFYVAISLSEAAALRRVIDVAAGSNIAGAGLRLAFVTPRGPVLLGSLQTYTAPHLAVAPEPLLHVEPLLGLDHATAVAQISAAVGKFTVLLNTARVAPAEVPLAAASLARLELFVPSTSGWVDDLHAAAQAFRFFDCALWFTDEELVKLARALGAAPPAARAAFFSAVVGARRRDRVEWRDTKVAGVLAQNALDAAALFALRATTLRVAALLAAQHASALAAFHALDADSDGWISSAEFTRQLSSLAAADVEAAFAAADRDADGLLSYREFASYFWLAESVVAAPPGLAAVSVSASPSSSTFSGLDLVASPSSHVEDRPDASPQRGHRTPSLAVMSYSELASIGTTAVVSGGKAMITDASRIVLGELEVVTVVPRGVELAAPGAWYFEVVVEGGSSALDATISLGLGTQQLAVSSAMRRGVAGVDLRFAAHDIVVGDVVGGLVTVSLASDGGVAAALTVLINGEPLTEISYESGPPVFPAVTLEWPAQARVNFGGHPFVANPLPRGAEPLLNFAHARKERIHVLNAGSRYGLLKPTSGSAQMTITDDLEVSVESGFPSAVLQGCLLTTGKWYYEATIVRRGVAQIGFADLEFVGSSRDGVGVGDDKNSVGVDYERCVLWYDGRNPFGKAWSVGTVVGVAVDMDAKTISFSHNGDFSKPCGRAMTNFDFVAGLAPGVTLNPCAIRLNWGHTPLAHAPPPGHLSVADWLEAHSPSSPCPEAIARVATSRVAAAAAAATAPGAALRVAAGHAALAIDTEDAIVESVSPGYPTAWARAALPLAPGAMFEVTLLEFGPEAVASIGVARHDFVGDATSALGAFGGVGHTHTSRAIFLQGISAASRYVPPLHDFGSLFGTRPSAGAVIGVAVDREPGGGTQIWYALNGKWVATNDTSLEFGSLYPAISLTPNVVAQFNLGGRPFDHPRP